MKKLAFEVAEKLEVTIKGKQNILEYPEWGMIEELEEKGENLQGSDVKKFLMDCGLSEESIKACQMKQLTEIYQELIGLKKN